MPRPTLHIGLHLVMAFAPWPQLHPSAAQAPSPLAFSMDPSDPSEQSEFCWGRLMFGLGKRAAENKLQGEKLFKLGMKAAVDFRSNDAINLYTQSIASSANPSPYMNRANLLGKRVRHYEALQDLLQAQKLDRSQGRQFGPILDFEIARTSVMTSSYTNGLREKLIADLKEKGAQYVARRLLSVSFKIPEIRWDYGVVAEPMIEFHFFNELDNIIKFDDLAIYPEAAAFAKVYPAEFIDLKLEQFPDLDAYQQQEVVLHGFLCSYPQDQMVRLRRSMLYQIHEQLLTRDFGALHMSLTSECNGIIKEAEEFLEAGDAPEEAEMPQLVAGIDAADLLTEDGKFDRVLDQIAEHIRAISGREDYVYRYVVEEADLLSKGTEFDVAVLQASGITPLEYEGESDNIDDHVQSRPGVDYLNNEVCPDFESLIGSADKIRALLFAKIYGGKELAMCRLRQKYAHHYRSICLAQGDFAFVNQWDGVIASIASRMEELVPAAPSADHSQAKKDDHVVQEDRKKEVWPFTKKNTVELHPLLERFREIMRNPRCLECFESFDSGISRMLPMDVGYEVQEAINLSYSITSMGAVHSSALIRAAKKDDFRSINDRLLAADRTIDDNASGNATPLNRIIEWANDYKLPELRSHDAMFYKEAGVPRNAKKLARLRYLLVMEDYGIEQIPAELAHLPQLVGICVNNNKIKSIPSALYGCPSLQRLDLEDNEITDVPDGIHKLKNVYAIDLSGNKLHSITPDIAKMPSLTKLDVSNQRTEVDFMRAKDTPMSQAGLEAMYRLVERIDVKY